MNRPPLPFKNDHESWGRSYLFHEIGVGVNVSGRLPNYERIFLFYVSTGGFFPDGPPPFFFVRFRKECYDLKYDDFAVSAVWFGNGFFGPGPLRGDSYTTR